MADRILKTIVESKPDLVLDLHNDWIKSIPYVLVDKCPANSHREAYARAKSMAVMTGFVMVTDSEELKGALSYNLLLRDIPALTLELGEPRIINEKNVEYGVNAIWNILERMEMIAPLETRYVHPSQPATGAERFLTYSDRPFSSTSGIVRFNVKPGDEVGKGKAFAKIVNAFGKHQETLRAVDCGIVLGHSDSAAVFPGMPVMAFGVK
jgi:predicted deacylase